MGEFIISTIENITLAEWVTGVFQVFVGVFIGYRLAYSRAKIEFEVDQKVKEFSEKGESK